ncbi:cytochrome P450 [Mycena rebaudengoi]|nr:cytochrome P450 [Mycena rebaudengoi]
MLLLNPVAAVVGTLGLYSLFRIFQVIYKEIRSPLRSVAGPRACDWLLGNQVEIKDNIGGSLERDWFHQYGRTFRINGFFGNLGRIVGPGILVVEDDVHKQQRKIMNPAFGAPQVRELTGIFIEKSLQLRDVWLGEAAKSGGVGNVDGVSWLTKATLDIIGLAGGAPRDELDVAFTTISTTPMNFMSFLKANYPVLRAIPTKMDTIIDNSQAVMLRIGQKLLHESKNAIVEGGAFQSARTRDLLSLLVRANTSKDIPESQRLSDKDVLARECSSANTGLLELNDNDRGSHLPRRWARDYENRLRDELLTVSTDNPTMDELNALVYLDYVVRETLRLHAPVPFAGRMAIRDDVIPLSTPYTDVNGTVHESLRILKGQDVVLPIRELNRDPEIWGPDSLEFKCLVFVCYLHCTRSRKFRPERWEASTAITNSIPGAWGHMLTFLGGPRSCIGLRFSLVELKALLFTLVRGLEFELAVPAADIGSQTWEFCEAQSTALGNALLAGSAITLFGWDLTKPKTLAEVKTKGSREFTPEMMEEGAQEGLAARR